MSLREPGTFDLVMAQGLLHHLEDAEARQLFETARHALRADGAVVTLDPAFDAGQSRVARWLVARDRGRRVRTPEAYAALARAVFPAVEVAVYHDLLRFPFTHCLLKAVLR